MMRGGAANELLPQVDAAPQIKISQTEVRAVNHRAEHRAVPSKVLRGHPSNRKRPGISP